MLTFKPKGNWEKFHCLLDVAAAALKEEEEKGRHHAREEQFRFVSYQIVARPRTAPQENEWHPPRPERPVLPYLEYNKFSMKKGSIAKKKKKAYIPQLNLNNKHTSYDPPRSMPEHMSEYITGTLNGRDILYVGSKSIKESDVKGQQNRLPIPIQKVVKVLTKSEIRHLDGKVNSLYVPVMNGECKIFNGLTFKKWPSMKKYVFIGKWGAFVKENKIKATGREVEVWSFRRENSDNEGGLCFAFNVRRSAGGDDYEA